MSELPADWTAACLGDAIESTFYGPRFGAQDYVDNGIPTIRTTDMADDGSVVFRDPPKVAVDASSLERFGLQDGDLLVTRTGSIGKCALYRTALGPALPSAYLIRVRLNKNLCDPDFALRFMMSPLGQSHLLGSATAVTQPNVNAKAIAAMEMPLPPMATQRRIVAKLDDVLARSRRAKQALDAVPPLLEKLRQSVLAAAFRGDLTADWRATHPDVEPADALLGRIRVERRKKWEEAELAKMKAKGKPPSDDRWKVKYKEPEAVEASGLPELPEGWAWARADEVVEPGTVISYGIVLPKDHVLDGVPYIRGQDIEDGRILAAQLLRTTPEIAAAHSRSELHEGDVLLCIIRHLKVAIVPSGLDGANVTQGTVRLRPSSAIGREFLASYLAGPFAQEWMKSRYFGLAMPRINVEDAREIPIPLAPLREQERIIAKVAANLSFVRTSREIAGEMPRAVEQLERALLAKAFRGGLSDNADGQTTTASSSSQHAVDTRDVADAP